MRQKLFTVAAAVSAVLCVGVCVLWARSYAVQHALTEVRAKRLVVITASYGEAFWHEVRQPPGGLATFGPPEGWSLQTSRPPWRLPPPNGLTTDFRLAGFEYCVRGPPLTYRRVAAPCWGLATLFAIAPAVWVFRTRSVARRARSNQCLSCGYDLRATPDRCPECGAVPGQAKGAA